MVSVFIFAVICVIVFKITTFNNYFSLTVAFMFIVVCQGFIYDHKKVSTKINLKY